MQDMKVNLMCIVSQGILLNLNFMATLFTGSVFLLADRLGVGLSEILLEGDFFYRVKGT